MFMSNTQSCTAILCCAIACAEKVTPSHMLHNIAVNLAQTHTSVANNGTVNIALQRIANRRHTRPMFLGMLDVGMPAHYHRGRIAARVGTTS